jgi:hypothetical protein
MPVNILNPPVLRVSDFKETEAEYHIRAEPTATYHRTVKLWRRIKIQSGDHRKTVSVLKRC